MNAPGFYSVQIISRSCALSLHLKILQVSQLFIASESFHVLVCDKYVNFNAMIMQAPSREGCSKCNISASKLLRDAFRIVNSFTLQYFLPTSAVLLVHEFQAALDILFRNNAYGHSTHQFLRQRKKTKNIFWPKMSSLKTVSAYDSLNSVVFKSQKDELLYLDDLILTQSKNLPFF